MLFSIGYAVKSDDRLLLEIIAGESSHLYRKLYDEGLIDSSFSFEVSTSKG